MQKIFIGQGRWFDFDTAYKFDSKQFTAEDGHRDKATGGIFTRQTLYFTKKGNWILSEWDERSPEEGAYRILTENEACQWLATQNEQPWCLPDDIMADMKQKIADLEL
jgi:hypothetical protein